LTVGFRLQTDQHAFQQNFLLYLPTEIVFVVLPLSVDGACITSESISSRCRRITIGRRAETKTSPVGTNHLRIHKARFSK